MIVTNNGPRQLVVQSNASGGRQSRKTQKQVLSAVEAMRQLVHNRYRWHSQAKRSSTDRRRPGRNKKAG